jgi:hypothetical protein
VSDEASVQRVERTLRRVAQLRTLFLRLPHLPSPREQARIAEFECFVAGERDECSPGSLEAGFRDAHRRLDAMAILAAAQRAGAWIANDPVLHPYYYWAQQASRDSTVAARPPESPRE